MSCLKPLFIPVHATERSVFGGFIPTWLFKWQSRNRTCYIPCGKCAGCRIDHARSWSVRCIHEASLYEHNCFVNLTFDNEHLPKDGSIRIKHVQDFMKRLRKYFTGQTIRYFACGEYGGKTRRPHYHLILFNCAFADMRFLHKSKSRHPLYVSKVLSKLWKFGFHTIGTVNIQSAAYVARYSLKKASFEDSFYKTRAKEFITMSRRGGIGSSWFSKYWHDVYGNLKDDIHIVTSEGTKTFRPPRFYDKLMERLDFNFFYQVKLKRFAAAGMSYLVRYIDGVKSYVNDTTNEVFDFVALESKAIFVNQRANMFVRDIT